MGTTCTTIELVNGRRLSGELIEWREGCRAVIRWHGKRYCGRRVHDSPTPAVAVVSL